MQMTDRYNLNHLRCKAPAYDEEARHFVRCPDCDQAVDLRKLGDVAHHMEPGHGKLPIDS